MDQLLCNKYGKIVICAGLDSNSERDYYPNVMNLIPKCDSAYKLTGLCSIKCDSSKGIFSKSIDGKTMTVSRQAYLEKNWIISSGIDKNKYEKKDTLQFQKANSLQIKNVNSAFGNDHFSYIFYRSMNAVNMSYLEFTLRQFLNSSEKGLTVVDFKRFSLS